MKALWNPDDYTWRKNLKHTVVNVCLAILALRTFYDWELDTKYKLILIVICTCFSHLVLNGLMAFVKNLFKDGAIFDRIMPGKKRD